MEGASDGAPQTAQSPPGIKRDRPSRRRRWEIVVAVTLVALAIIIPTILVAGPDSPWVEAVLAQGRAYIDVPLTTMYTAPALPNATGNTSSKVSFASGNVTCLENETSHQGTCDGRWADLLAYDWSAVAETGLPVRFLMTPEPSMSDPQRSFESSGTNHFWYYPVAPNTFRWYPLGTITPPPVASYLNASQSGPGLSFVFVTKWAMDYTVRKMGVFQGLVPTSFLEVDYSLTVLDRGSVLPLPAANVSLPSPGDLWTPAAALSADPGVRWGWNGLSALSSFTLPPPPVSYNTGGPYFRYNVTPITIDAGTAGSLTARIHSSFWSSYAETDFSWNATTHFHLSVDMRFGSVQIEYIPTFAP